MIIHWKSFKVDKCYTFDGKGKDLSLRYIARVACQLLELESNEPPFMALSQGTESHHEPISSYSTLRETWGGTAA